MIEDAELTGNPANLPIGYFEITKFNLGNLIKGLIVFTGRVAGSELMALVEIAGVQRLQSADVFFEFLNIKL